MDPPALRRLRRIEVRLPLSIGLVLALTVGAFSVMAYREVRDSALVAAGNRLTDVGRQIHDLLAPAVEQRHEAARELADRPEVVAAVTGSGATESLDPVLSEILDSGGQVDRVTLWRADGVRIAESIRDSALVADSSRFPIWAEGRASIGEIRASGDVAWFEIVTPVTEEGGPGGFLVERRTASTGAAGVRFISDLTGMSARLFVGSPGGEWTDLGEVVEGPPIASIERGRVTEYAQAGGHWLGAGLPLEDTPWFIWVDAPRGLVLARPQAFLERMIPLGIGVVLIGGLVGWLLSRSVTGRLSLVSAAATAVARGDYGRRVPTGTPDELGELAEAFNVMADRVEASHDRLERLVAERTAALQQHAMHLEASNRELEAFSYSVSHDLRSPLRALHGFSEGLLEDYESSLDEQGRHDLERVCAAADRMNTLIDSMLDLSRISRAEIALEPIDLSDLADDLAREVAEEHDDRRLEVSVQPGLRATGDPHLLRIALKNLIENAWKFTARREGGRIEVGARENGGDPVFFVRDNGAGFDMEHAEKLFAPFQRLHRVDEFPGTGIGLATVQRVIRRHGGRIWAQAEVDHGATFFFTLFEGVLEQKSELAEAGAESHG